jgi:hypothetical protein
LTILQNEDIFHIIIAKVVRMNIKDEKFIESQLLCGRTENRFRKVGNSHIKEGEYIMPGKQLCTHLQVSF